MALILKRICESYVYAMTELPDPRTNDWFLIKSPIPIFFIIASYLIFVKDVGVKFMSNREPFKLKEVLIVYNVIQIVFALYIAITIFPGIITLNPLCSEVDYSDDPLALTFASHTWCYFMIKILDLLDTVFFILKKKKSQVTFLHIYHHCIMVFIAWMGTKYVAGGHSVYLGYINCVVHGFMYTYYLLTSFEKYRNKVWWKKYITQLQLLQFTLFSLIFLGPLLNRNCGYSKFLALIFVPQNALMVCMFSDFYYKAYIKKKMPTV